MVQQMTDEELLAHQRNLAAQNDLNHFRIMLKVACLTFVGMFLFGVTGLLILKVLS